jgi:hypothetical protein
MVDAYIAPHMQEGFVTGVVTVSFQNSCIGMVFVRYMCMYTRILYMQGYNYTQTSYIIYTYS